MHFCTLYLHISVYVRMKQNIVKHACIRASYLYQIIHVSLTCMCERCVCTRECVCVCVCVWCVHMCAPHGARVLCWYCKIARYTPRNTVRRSTLTKNTNRNISFQISRYHRARSTLTGTLSDKSGSGSGVHTEADRITSKASTTCRCR